MMGEADCQLFGKVSDTTEDEGHEDWGLQMDWEAWLSLITSMR